jgi:hypothetical protein
MSEMEKAAALYTSLIFSAGAVFGLIMAILIAILAKVW